MNHEPVSATVESPAPRCAWQRCVEADPTAIATQTPEWTDAATAASRLRDGSRYYTFSDGSTAVLPLLQRCIGGRPIAAWSIPMNLGFGGLVGAPSTPARVAAVMADLRQQKLAYTSIRPLPTVGDAWDLGDGASAVQRYSHVLDLRGGLDEVWTKRLNRKARNYVRRAERNGVEVECDTTGRLAPEFDRLLSLSVERWAGQQREPLWLARARAARRDPPGRWGEIAKRLDGKCHIWVARIDGRTAAALILLLGPAALSIRSAMDHSLVKTSRANELLEWSAIRDAVEHGCDLYHLGETTPDSSLAHFKERFGATLVPYTEVRTERLPLTAADQRARELVKRAIGFRDA
ncbi:MAG: GNAT family N-acetyltransferase [Acidimicrobiales bacterium]|nr:GNAT family N-acetyltransferase [Acidimicrobiales bacterium]